MKILVIQILMALLLGGTTGLYAQHEHHPPAKKEPVKTSPKKTVTNKLPSKRASTRKKNAPITSKMDSVAGQMKDTVPSHAGHFQKDTVPGVESMHAPQDSMPMMTHSYSLNLPMNRNSSG